MNIYLVTCNTSDEQQETVSSIDQPTELRTPDIYHVNNPFSLSQPSKILNFNEDQTNNLELRADLTLSTDSISDISDDVFGDETLSFMDESFPLSPILPVSPSTTQISNALVVESTEWFIVNPLTNKRRRPLLYEFLQIVLDDPRYCEYASYANKNKGIFKLHKPNEIAALWKNAKGRNAAHDMTYDKLARALRFYYKKGFMMQTHGHYTFQFGPKSGFGTLWKPKD
ncbi:unnamed protein product [Didymodactylos carnosus]|uniref:ETS domain-containing protein n=1 Tax=Didymodactylos carnosus TaxID=1234261 RepID=A0A815ASZ7_9BILA|nr:unnamed protein product [Didymodactylos carnosus]CAF1260298.1 unnamed protein product [Didymodactylos carnosus]CAF3802105.1 unnamed protein product [Didymodactylos carnosus]CAF4037198.1 unnamed protein product [Didymodactylos carnosus]